MRGTKNQIFKTILLEIFPSVDFPFGVSRNSVRLVAISKVEPFSKFPEIFLILGHFRAI